MKRLLSIAALMVPLSVFSQQYFHKQMPPGNYSGICAVGNDCFAVVDNEAKEDGFYVFRIEIDGTKRRITRVENMGYRSSGMPNRDMEGICYHPSWQTVFVCGEADNEVYEYTLEGKRTGRRLAMPSEYKKARRHQGMESLAYDEHSHQFFVTTERLIPGDSLLRVQAFGDDLQPSRQYLYSPDKPISRKYYYGVSELCATGDGGLLVVERQIRVPRLKLNAHTITRIYEVRPADEPLLKKRLVKEFRTRLTLFGRKYANYEGICRLSPKQPTDSRLGCYLLIADSQYRHKKVLRDWMLLLDL